MHIVLYYGQIKTDKLGKLTEKNVQVNLFHFFLVYNELSFSSRFKKIIIKY